VSPLRGEKPQNRPLSKLNTGRFALRAMLPVIKKLSVVEEEKDFGVIIDKTLSRASNVLKLQWQQMKF